MLKFLSPKPFSLEKGEIEEFVLLLPSSSPLWSPILQDQIVISDFPPWNQRSGYSLNYRSLLPV